MKRREIFGFLIAPIVPALFFSFVATFYGSVNSMFTTTLRDFFFFIAIWFLMSIIFSYVCVLAVGIPGYYLLNKLKVNGMLSYMTIGGVLGLLLPIAYVPFTKSASGIWGVEVWVYILSAIFGFLSATTFWLIAVRVPTISTNGL